MVPGADHGGGGLPAPPRYATDSRLGKVGDREPNGSQSRRQRNRSHSSRDLTHTQPGFPTAFHLGDEGTRRSDKYRDFTYAIVAVRLQWSRLNFISFLARETVDSLSFTFLFPNLVGIQQRTIVPVHFSRRAPAMTSHRLTIRAAVTGSGTP